MRFKIILAAVLLSINYSSPVLAENFIQVPAAIQIDSSVSDGKYAIGEIVRQAKKGNFKVLIMTDRDLMRWEYGLWPLRNIIKKREEASSVFKSGVGRYFKQLADWQKAEKDLLIIPGVESAPFYYWDGSVLGNNFKIKNWHKHIISIGIDNVKGYKKLPVIGNKEGLLQPFSAKDILYFLFPVLIIFTGWLCFCKRRFDYKDLSGRQLGPYSKASLIIGAVLIITGLLFLVNNFPFRDYKFDSYHGDLGVLPYQNYIDYVNKQGGLAFWAHPEIENIEQIGRVGVETRDYSEDLYKTYDYAGFTVFYNGYEKVGRPSGIWDDLLKEYCEGKRKHPVWAIGGLGFDYSGDLGNALKDLRTMLLVANLNKPEVLKAIKEGRMYVIAGGNSGKFIMEKLIIKDSLNGNEKTMGGELGLEGVPLLEISGYFFYEDKHPLKIKLIRNGSIIQVFNTVAPFEISFSDSNFKKPGKSYYRIEIESNDLLLVSNPIFVVGN